MCQGTRNHLPFINLGSKRILISNFIPSMGYKDNGYQIEWVGKVMLDECASSPVAEPQLYAHKVVLDAMSGSRRHS
jgi:hypothetical protein